MKPLIWLLLAVLALSGCTPAATPTPTLSAPTETPLPLPSATPTLVPVTLAGPASGARMAWLDSSVLVYVPAGEFIMGLGYGYAPQKTVTLDGYWIYRTEVTDRMYAQCVATGNCAAPAQELGTPVFDNPDYGDYPVVGVTWDMAANYCSWVQGGLPSEAQWEKAARGSGGNLYPWGNDEPACDLSNFGGCLGHTTAVTDFENSPSPYGLLDMAGNVFEWANDFYGEAYYDSAPPVNPTGPASGDSHVIRGSSFESDVDQLLSALRHYAPPAQHTRDLGFRCVVSQPKALAPYCQAAAYIPGQTAQSGDCQLPPVAVNGGYCAGGAGFTTVDLPDGANFEILTSSFDCTEAVLDGQRRLTCSGPPDSTGEITVCNTACSGAPQNTGAARACDPGYNLDSASGACLYAPIAGQPGPAGCPAGYVLLDRGGQKTCALGLGQNGLCPAGLYLDSAYGACVSASGLADAPYGLDNAELAAQTYQGCAPGYTYDPAYQCCQAVTGGTYPGCPTGSTFDAALGACSPAKVRSSGPGCVTVSLYALKCSEPVDVCSKIKFEATCIRNSYACQWDDKQGVCLLK